MTTPAVHFIAGLPRSGSTLLAGILRQNPQFHAAATSPVGSVFAAVLGTVWSRDDETAALLTTDQKRDLLRGLFDSYYRLQAGKAVIFDTNRAWCAMLSALLDVHPGAKVLCCVRDVAWVMDSIERLVRKNAFEPSRLFGSAEERATVFSRVEALADRSHAVGFAWGALKEAFYGEHSRSLLLIEYDALCLQPQDTLRRVYDFLGEPWHEHDFDRVEYAEPEFDAQLAMPGLHTVKAKVQFTPRRTVLPPDLFERHSRLAFWRDPTGSDALRILISPELERPAS